MSLKKTNYQPRIIDRLIKEKLNTYGAVCIEGPKWCGKTWTALNHANSAIFIGDPQNSFQNRTMAELDPSIVLSGETPRLIDEWQEVPLIWDAVRHQVDQGTGKGQFLLTGSSTPQRKGILHGGTGRIDRVRMRPMSLYESGDSRGSVSLQDLMTGHFEPKVIEEVSLEKLIHLTARGGWPGSLNVEPSNALDIPRSYLHSVFNDDLRTLNEAPVNIAKFRALFRSLARNTSTMAGSSVLKNDIKEFEGETIDPKTIDGYLDRMDRMFLIENQPAFDPNYRSSTRVAKTPKRHFVDPSLAIAALELSPTMLLHDLNFFGFFFESLVIRDMRIYAEANQGRVFHYRHHDTGKEIDAIVEMPDGKWGAFEIKLGANQIEQAAENLLSVQKHLSQEGKASTPELLCVICGLSGYAYQRKDGVFVIPITTLRD